MPTTRQWLLDAHPCGRPAEAGDFRLVTRETGSPAEGEMLLATRYLGFDPAQKGWMENIADYVAPMAIGDVMRGRAVSEVLESRHPGFVPGDLKRFLAMHPDSLDNEIVAAFRQWLRQQS